MQSQSCRWSTQAVHLRCGRMHIWHNGIYSEIEHDSFGCIYRCMKLVAVHEATDDDMRSSQQNAQRRLHLSSDRTDRTQESIVTTYRRFACLPVTMPWYRFDIHEMPVAAAAGQLWLLVDSRSKLDADANADAG